jgi:hypothetical protein
MPFHQQIRQKNIVFTLAKQLIDAKKVNRDGFVLVQHSRLHERSNFTLVIYIINRLRTKKKKKREKARKKRQARYHRVEVQIMIFPKE